MVLPRTSRPAARANRVLSRRRRREALAPSRATLIGPWNRANMQLAGGCERQLKFSARPCRKSRDNRGMRIRPVPIRLLSRLAMLAVAAVATTAPASSGAANADASQKAAGASDRAASRRSAGALAGEGWRVAPPPPWVEQHAPAAPGAPGPLPARTGWHALLVDEQRAIDRNEDSGDYLMFRTLVTDASGLASAGHVEVSFDPTYQKVLLHSFAVWRDGHRLDRLVGARIEMLRREVGLENGEIDGRKTLLVVLNDVRVGDIVEISYSVLGQNPVHGSSHGGSLVTAFDMPVDRLFASVTSRSARRLRVQGVRTDALPGVQEAGGVQRWQLALSNVAAVQAEDGTPSDYAVYPRVEYSDDADWHEVAEWGSKLFKIESTLGPDLEHRIDAWRASGLRGQALISAALSLVQDEVRYFSASLGENSHRPKVPARTWADRAGDCKDKTALLVAILQRLGFDAKPALVSSTARNSLRDRLPGHDAFDHAIVRLQLDGRTWWLDGTLTSQSTRLDTRAMTPVDWALVVAPETQALEAVKASPIDGDLVTYDHVWDTSDLSKPAHLRLTVAARDEVAESYRAAIASGHLAELVDNITSHYRTRFQDYRALGEPVVDDDRVENRLSVHIEGEVPLLGDLHDGALSVEVFPLRIMDSLVIPDQLQRTMPWAWEPPRTIRERIHLVVPEPPHLATPLHSEVSDPHFALILTSSESGHERILDWRFQRRDDVVLPADLARFRDRIKKARADEDILLKEPLFNSDRLRARATEEAKAIDKDPRMLHDDTVTDQVSQAFALRVRDDLILAASGTTSPVGARTLVDRAEQHMLLGEDAAAQADLGSVATDALMEPAAHYTRGLVLFTAARFADAEKAFRAGLDAADPMVGPTRRWIGIAAYFDGRFSDAVRSLGEAVQDESGDERTITLAWLFVAAQHEDHHGEAAIAPYLPESKAESPTWATQLLEAIRALAVDEAKDAQSGAGWSDRPAAQQLVATLKKDPRLVRERTVQMAFFLSQLAMKSHERGAVVAMLQLESKLHATSAPEDICARTALLLAGRKAPADLVDSARKAAASGARRGAVEILHRAVAAAPDDTDALSTLGRVENDQMHCEALEPLTRAASLRPDDPVIGIELARAYAYCDGGARASSMLQHWLSDPHTPPTASAEGLAVRSMLRLNDSDPGHLKLSDDDAREALRIDPTAPIARQAMYHVHDAQGKYDELLADVDLLEAAGAPARDVSAYRGMALMQLKRDDEAEVELTKTLAIEPGNFLALTSRTKERLRREDAEGAAQDALAVVKLWPNKTDYWDSVLQAQAMRGDLKAALEAAEQKVRLQPDNAVFFAERADLKGGLRDYKGAVADYDRSLALDASDPDAWIDRATPLWQLDRGSDAVVSCHKGLALSDTPRHRATCTVVEWQVGDHAHAVQTLNDVLGGKDGVQLLSGSYWVKNFAMELLSYGRLREAAAWLKLSQKQHDWTYGAVFLYVARSLAGEEAGARAELTARAKPVKPQWRDHLVDYAAHQIDDVELMRLSNTGVQDDLPGQACEAVFYRGLRHWVDGDVAGGRTLLASAASTCPRTFNEALIARGWLAAGPGATSASPADPGSAQSTH